MTKRKTIAWLSSLEEDLNKEGKLTGGTKPCRSYLAVKPCRSSQVRHPAGGLTVQGKDMESSFLAEQVSIQISPRQPWISALN